METKQEPTQEQQRVAALSYAIGVIGEREEYSSVARNAKQVLREWRTELDPGKQIEHEAMKVQALSDGEAQEE